MEAKQKDVAENVCSANVPWMNSFNKECRRQIVSQ